MAKIPVSRAPSPQSRFLSLLKGDILKLDLAELDFGIYRILNYRRAQVLAYLDDTLPGRITAWTDALAKNNGRELASTEAENCYYHLHTFFARYWDDGDFIPRARRGGSAAYAVPYNGQDTHFHWATKGSHYVKSGELFARYAYKDGAHEVRFTLERAEVEKDNAKGSAKHFFPARVQAVEGGLSCSGNGAPLPRPRTNATKTRAPHAARTRTRKTFCLKQRATRRPPKAPACKSACSTPGPQATTLPAPNDRKP